MADHDELDPLLASVARELRRPVHFDSQFDDRVMAALEPGVIPLPSSRSIFARRPWYSRTLSVTVTPLRGLAAAAALAGIVGFSMLRGRTSAEGQVATLPVPETALSLQPVANATVAPSNAAQQKQFIILVPGATSVSLVGDFNDWDASRTPMERVSADGVWSVMLPLRPGRYEFQYEVDGSRRMTDPSRPQSSSDFGSPNSVVTIDAKE